MATPTAACPECGTATSPGRYTCAACGSFLEGVRVAPRSWEPEGATVAIDDPAPGPAEAATSAGPAASWEHDPEVDSAAGPSVDVRAVEWPSFDDARSVLSESVASPVWPRALEPAEPAPSPAEAPAPAQVAPQAPSLAPAPASAAALQPLPAPEPRVPAGSWLPPSALLTGLDDSNVTASAVAVPRASRPSLQVASARDWLAALGTRERRWATARQAIAVGAAIGVFGFLLPWANASPGSLVAVWTSVWGLVFPGSWLIVLAVAGFGLLAASSGRLAAIPLGVPSIALASMLLGLIWPTLIGASSRPIGIIVVFVGAVVVGAGGIIHLGARHEAATPDV